jgi:hypothetical protein
MSTANGCRNRGLNEHNAETLIAARISRPPSPANEIRSAIRKAYRDGCKRSSGRTLPGRCRSPVPITAIKFDPAKLAAVAARVKQPHSWRHFLWERSPKRPETQNPYSFLMNVYNPGERVLIFDDMTSKTPAATVMIDNPMDCRVPVNIAGGGKGHGVWFLCNPVDGDQHTNSRQGGVSCRSEESITSFRYAVLESDEAPAKDWLAFLVQLPVKISGIYTSGGRSIHALLCVDAASKAVWDSEIQPLKRQLKVMGADAGALSAVRLTRLPQCRRPDKNGYQELLYLNPNPQPIPLIETPAIHSRTWTLARM